MPSFAIERTYVGAVCGIDEAGRGPLAGPVVAVAVVLNRRRLPRGIDDSKKVPKEKRAYICDVLLDSAKVGIGHASVEEIDTHNILRASLLAMERAYLALPVDTPVTAALVDGNQPPSLPCTTHCLIGGDGVSTSIAAASIIAKVTRDRLMQTLAEEFPHHGFERHAGYGTACHLEALRHHGPTPHHRRSFAPVRAVIEALTPAG